MPGRGYLTWLASRGGKVMRMASECIRVFLPREKVVRAARRAIDKSRRLYGADVDISTSLVRRLMRVARTHNEFAVGTWYIDGRCGCLVGNLLGSGFGRLSPAEEAIGLSFDLRIREEMSAEQRARVDVSISRFTGPRIVTVRG